jgi:hypothetical protein
MYKINNEVFVCIGQHEDSNYPIIRKGIIIEFFDNNTSYLVKDLEQDFDDVQVTYIIKSKDFIDTDVVKLKEKIKPYLKIREEKEPLPNRNEVVEEILNTIETLYKKYNFSFKYAEFNIDIKDYKPITISILGKSKEELKDLTEGE